MPNDRRSRRHDDDDDRPRRDRRRDEVDEDDRPRSRYRDEDDDRPRKRRRGRFNPLWIILPVGGAIALLVLGVVLYVFVLDGGAGGPPNDMLAWAPADATHVVFIDYAVLKNNPDLARTPLNGLDRINMYGLDPGEMDSLLHATGGNVGSVTVVRATTSLEPDRVLQKLGGRGNVRALTASGKTYYQVSGQGYVYFPSPRMMVVAHNQKVLTERIGTTEGTVLVSADLKKQLGRASGHALSVNVPRPGTMTVNGDKVRSVVKYVRVVNDRVERTSEIDYEDPNASGRVYEQARSATNSPGVTSRATRSGNRVTITYSATLQQMPFVLQEYLMEL